MFHLPLKPAAHEAASPSSSTLAKLPAPAPPDAETSATSPGLSETMATGTVASGLGRLTACEREFLGWLVEGYSYQQIADSMNVSINTVRDYVRTAYKKLHVNSRTQAVVKYLRFG